MLMNMTTNEYVYARPDVTEDVLSENDWTPFTESSRKRGSMLVGGLRRRLASPRHLGGRRVHPRSARPTRHSHRPDFIERAAMSREMHRL